jgi:hypothetical protein
VPTTEGAVSWIVTTNNGKYAYSGHAGTAADRRVPLLDAAARRVRPRRA